MTMPLWMAAPPEIHSALLSAGPGPGPLLAAAEAWKSLSAEYADVAAELSAVVATVRAGTWDGPSADSYAAANEPYAVWLSQQAIDAAATATEHEAAAGAYSAALAAMPTLTELAANHATHAALLATNFLGINTIPITLNEADYARMWVQAATTMTVYQDLSNASLAALPPTNAAPPVLKSEAAAAGTDFSVEGIYASWQQFVQTTILRLFGISGNEVPYQLPALEAFLAAPSLETLNAFVFAMAVGLSIDGVTFGLPAALLTTPLLPLVALNVAGLAGLGLFKLLQLPPLDFEFPELPAALPDSSIGTTAPAVGAPLSVSSPAPGGTTVSAPLSSAAPAPAPNSAPAPNTPGLGYLVYGGGPDDGGGPRLIEGGKAKAPAADIAAAAAAPGRASAPQRARRRRRSVMRDHGDEYLDMESGLPTPPDHVTSTATTDHGAGRFGFTGTVPSTTRRRPEGLASLGDDFGGGPVEPMLPRTWGGVHGDDPSESGTHEEPGGSNERNR